MTREEILAIAPELRAPCPSCLGTGEVHSHNPRCWDCHGIGEVARKDVPRLRAKGQLG